MSQQKQAREQWNQRLEALLLDIASTAQKAGKRYYIGGGFAIDLTFGGVSRPHGDLDFYPMEEDTQWWKDWFRSQGYIVSRDTDMENLPNAFSLVNENHDYFADVYPIAIGKNGEISMLVKEDTHEVWDGMLTIQGTRGVWQGKSWNEVREVNYKGQAIAVENYKTVLMQKEEYIKLHPGEALSEKHLHDFHRAGIEPEI
ncbi:MAG TPA: hypothetical protein VIZ18_10825 [Ktedonobacteraceae bacterium]